MTTRITDHDGSVGHAADITVADDRYPTHGFHDFTDTRMRNRAAKSLFARATVNGDRTHANLFKFLRKKRRRQIVSIPAQPHFHTDR